MTNPMICAEAHAAYIRGWCPVPMLLGDDKHPSIRWKDYQTIPPSAEEVVDWFNPASRHLNWGMIHGAVAGTILLDLDNKPHLGGLGQVVDDLIVEFGPLPAGPSVTTPSGGLHLLFIHPGYRIKTRRNVRPGLDIRADGGFSVGPGSRSAKGVYRWLDDPAVVPLEALPEPWLALLLGEPARGGGKPLGDASAASWTIPDHPPPAARVTTTADTGIVLQDVAGPFGLIFQEVVDVGWSSGVSSQDCKNGCSGHPTMRNC